MSAQWHKIREVFDAALQQPPAERHNYINRACGDDKTLQAEVVALFSSLDQADDFLQQPAVAAVADVIATPQRLAAGTRLGHYEILRPLGSGGMGEVYLAHDNKLERQVAIKILNDKYNQDAANLARFTREAKAASALNHPNILVIHEIGETDETQYIVSEYVAGRTLREVLSRDELTLAQILDIASQLAGACAAAHEARIIHRDLKPENVMVRPDGYVKVLDFGLAKLVKQKRQSFLGAADSTVKESQTGQGVILGTVNYMSPEQAKAEKVDERTDIFSLGVVLYEMVTGRTPFAGASVSDTLANLIKTEPQPLERFTAHAPAELQRIVGKLLRKDKDARYQTMKGLLADLKELRENLKTEEKLERPTSSDPHATTLLHAATGDANLNTAATQNTFSQRIQQHKPLAAFVLAALLIGAIVAGYYFFAARKTVAVGGKKTIAVLPVKPINTANRDEIYEIGIADSLINRLGLVKGFIVRPLSATRKYADIMQDPLAAGREQQTDYVLAANYQLAGGRIRITAQLFNVATGQIEETYQSEKDAGNIFALQDAIAGEVGSRLQARFVTTSGTPATKRGTTNDEAYRLYLQGKNLTAQRSPADAKKAIENFEQAIRLDPNYALAFAGMARAYIASGSLGGGLPREQFEKGRAAVNRALELDPNLAEAYAVRADVKFKYEWDFAGAEKDLAIATELDPNRFQWAEIHAVHLANRGRFDEALAAVEIALEVDPNSLTLQRERGRFLYFARRYDEAIVQLKRVLEVDGNFQTAYGWLFRAYEIKGDHAMAYESFIKWKTIQKDEHLEDYQKAYQTLGWQGLKRQILDVNKLNQHQPNSNLYAIAWQCALLNEKEQAFEYLNKAFEKRHSQMVMLNVEPAFDSLRADPRFAALVSRVGLQ